MLRKLLFFVIFTCCASLPLLSSADNIEIFNLSDFPFGLLNPGSPDQHITKPVCIYRSGGPWSSRTYYVTATGTVPGGGLFIANASGATMEVVIRWSTSPSSYVILANGERQGPFDGAARFQSICTSGNNNAWLQVTIPASAIASATVGEYSGEVQLLLEEA